MNIFDSLKFVSPFVALFASVAVITADCRAEQFTSYSDAHRAALQTHRPLIVALGAAWCLPCRQLEAQYTPHLAARGCYVHLDIDRDRRIVQQFSGISAVPAIIIYEHVGGVWRRPQIIVGLPAIRLWLGAP